MEEDHSSVYFIRPPLQSSTDEKKEMAVKAGEETGIEEGLQAGKEMKTSSSLCSHPPNKQVFCKKVTSSFSA